MSSHASFPAPRLDLDRLARSGPSSTAPCAVCGCATRSHVLLDTGDAWREYTDPAEVSVIPDGEVVRFAILCHSCLIDLDLPATGDAYDELADGVEDSEAVIEGVVG